MVVEYFITVSLCYIKLVRIPILCEDLLDVVLVHAEVGQMCLRARLANERAIGYVCVRRLSLVAVDAVGIELIVRHERHHQVAQDFGLWLLE